MSDVNLAKRLFGEFSPESAAGESGIPSTAEGLRLFKAFTSIKDASLRRSVIHLVEILGAPAAGKR